MNTDSPLFRFRIWYAALPRVLRALMTIQVGVFVAVLLLSISQAALLALFGWFGLTPDLGVLLRRPWQPFTYTFLNPVGGFFGLISFLFAMFWLYWLGRNYEEFYGSHRLFGLYAMTALAGALVAILLYPLLLNGAEAGLAIPTGTAPFFPFVGLWGPVIGLLCAVAALDPRREMGLFLLGNIQLKWIAIGFVVLDVLLTRDVTHLGAAAMGWGFGTAQRGGTDLAAWALPLFRSRSASRSAPPRAPRRENAARTVGRFEGWLARRDETAGRSPEAGTEEPSPKGARGSLQDVDRILDKILEEGYDALTTEEKRILEDASRR